MTPAKMLSPTTQLAGRADVLVALAVCRGTDIGCLLGFADPPLATIVAPPRRGFLIREG
jgi:hypothetical protein